MVFVLFVWDKVACGLLKLLLLLVLFIFGLFLLILLHRLQWWWRLLAEGLEHIHGHNQVYDQDSREHRPAVDRKDIQMGKGLLQPAAHAVEAQEGQCEHEDTVGQQPFPTPLTFRSLTFRSLALFLFLTLKKAILVFSLLRSVYDPRNLHVLSVSTPKLTRFSTVMILTIQMPAFSIFYCLFSISYANIWVVLNFI